MDDFLKYSVAILLSEHFDRDPERIRFFIDTWFEKYAQTIRLELERSFTLGEMDLLGGPYGIEIEKTLTEERHKVYTLFSLKMEECE